MKNFVKTSVATAVVMGVALIAGSASAGIANTKHNLGSSGPATNNNIVAETGEICVFCHTPHGGDTGAAVPLWNKVLSTATYQTYDQLGTSTLDGGITTIGSVSLACLTCHDGTQALDNILNAPGSGGYDSTGGGVGGKLWTWSTGGDLGAALTVDTTGTFLAGQIVNLGTDLRDDHPVSVQYGGGGVSATTPTGATVDADFVAPLQIGADDRWYVDNATMAGSLGSTLGSFDKWDFKLYTRLDAALANVNEPFVECGSCHDPHMETTTFLRIDGTINPDGTESNSGSRVCLACHIK
jgi:hypothetical protein